MEKFVEACEAGLGVPYTNWAPEDFDQAIWETMIPRKPPPM
ncbi:hypothetical protein [Streptomyces lydicus]